MFLCVSPNNNLRARQESVTVIGQNWANFWGAGCIHIIKYIWNCIWKMVLQNTLGYIIVVSNQKYLADHAANLFGSSN